MGETPIQQSKTAQSGWASTFLCEPGRDRNTLGMHSQPHTAHSALSPAISDAPFVDWYGASSAMARAISAAETAGVIFSPQFSTDRTLWHVR